MVAESTILGLSLAIVLTIFVPLGLIVYFYKRERISISSVLIGAATFFVFFRLLSICKIKPPLFCTIN
jgi:uncharacterized membrane protein YhfC